MSPNLKSIEQLYEIQRPTDVPKSGLLCDILWSDPSPEVDTWGENRKRGKLYFFFSYYKTVFVFHFEISGKVDKDEHPLNIKCI